MISKLYIQNYALIERLEVDFHPGLTILTGETGAGKSIILGALSLILGQRADPKALRDPGKKCVVEGTFSIDRYRLQGFFEVHDLDYEGSTMLRREIAVNGKSRAFINDTPVGLAQLKELGTYLIDIHSQQETLSLNQPEVQLSLVDAFAGLQEQVREYRNAYNQYTLQQQELEALEAQEQQARLDRDYWQFQWEELCQANLDPNEQETLEAEVHTLAHAEEIKTALVQAVDGLREAEDNPLSRLHQLQPLLQRVQGHHAGVRELAERLASVAIELDDIVDELEAAGEQVVHDPERLVAVNDRLDMLYALQQKHRVQTVDSLIALRESLDGKLRDGVSMEDRINALRTANAALLQELSEKAMGLSEQRADALPGLAGQVHATLAELQMPHARLHLEQERLAAPGPAGIDQIRWLFAANKGSVPRPLQKVASGGELSRLMLSIRAELAGLTALPTIVFDEIDTGVSGDVADRVGQVMQRLASGMQVLSITHLPQIAGKGDHHYEVSKSVSDGATVTRLETLSEEQRVEAIARLLSGKELTTAAMDNARELLGV